jgi:hypothetical protein
MIRALSIAAFVVGFIIGAAEAKPRAAYTYNGGLSIKHRGHYTFVAPPSATNPNARLHCSTTRRTTTCLSW